MKIRKHPGRVKFAHSLRAMDHSLTTTFTGALYRFLNPRFTRPDQILDGAGGLHASGRWNPAGAFRISYTALTPETALAEALAHVRYYHLPEAQAMPRVLVAMRLEAHRVLDLRNAHLRDSIGMTLATIKKLDWRAENQAGREALTQAWGDCFCQAGFAAILVPSAADKAGANVLVFPGNLSSRDRFESFGDIKWPGK